MCTVWFPLKYILIGFIQLTLPTLDMARLDQPPATILILVRPLGFEPKPKHLECPMQPLHHSPTSDNFFQRYNLKDCCLLIFAVSYLVFNNIMTKIKISICRNMKLRTYLKESFLEFHLYELQSP